MSVHTGLLKTVRSVLPYDIRMLPNGKVSIKNTRDQVLYVTRGEVDNILQRDDLDVHRRRLYEAVLELFKKETEKHQ